MRHSLLVQTLLVSGSKHSFSNWGLFLREYVVTPYWLYRADYTSWRWCWTSLARSMPEILGVWVHVVSSSRGWKLVVSKSLGRMIALLYRLKHHKVGLRLNRLSYPFVETLLLARTRDRTIAHDGGFLLTVLVILDRKYGY